MAHTLKVARYELKIDIHFFTIHLKLTMQLFIRDEGEAVMKHLIGIVTEADDFVRVYAFTQWTIFYRQLIQA